MTNPLPNITDYQWLSRSVTNDSITVRHSSPFLPKTVPYVIYISVHANSDLSFTIVASVHAIELQLGVPHQGAVVMLEEVLWSFFRTLCLDFLIQCFFALLLSCGCFDVFVVF